MTQYVLRAYCFGYNDENFYVCGTRINDVFESRESADAAYRNAQLSYLRDLDLAEHENVFDGDQSYISKMDEYIREKTGKSIKGDNDWVDLGSDTHTELSDDDLFEFGEKFELHAYKLVAFENEPVFHTLWNPREERYFQMIDESFEGLVYGASLDEVMKMIEDEIVTLDWEGLEMTGSPEELSDSPDLLRKFIATADEIEYDESEGMLRFGYPEAKTVIGLNALLKESIFEVRELSVDEIRDLEKEIGGYHGGGQIGFFDGCGWTVFKFLAWVLVPIALIAAGRCTFGTCNNYLETFGNTAWLAFKWFGIVVLALVALVWGFFRYRRVVRRKKKQDSASG